MRSHLLAASLALATALSAGGALAQDASVRGLVTDTAGTALEGALVEAWSPDRLLASRVTAADGTFSFPARLTGDISLLRAHRLGYRRAERRVESSAAPYRLSLVEEPIPLRGFVVEPDQRTCESRDDERARRLWRAMSRKYAGPLDTVGIATYLAEKEALVERDGIGPLELPSEKLAQRGSSSQLRFSWTRQARESGYAFPVRRTESGSSFDSWSYAPLEADFSPHFVDPVFADLHRFGLRDSGEFGWSVEFCPEDPERPSIRGSLHLSPDTTLLSAEWLFDTPDPDESAGGRAVFRPTEGASARDIPLPAESLVWRRLPTGRFQAVHQRYEEWIVAQGDTVPFLAPR